MARVSPSSPSPRPGVPAAGAAPDTGALPTVSPAPADDPRGLALGFTAYFVWGLLPL
ncbi:EamA family transporter RarD, partial [Xanthomonas citri pv. citri]|nr:EamA family transporter RarD [Xanthomonas citri pv. citri]